mmetsp:Transcript_19940/g.36869  ORF Transcript_19940/g.36869 Transcript_19940/m.36869 type:complete len:714 (+) Transcript_19940:355-2496(+)
MSIRSYFKTTKQPSALLTELVLPNQSGPETLVPCDIQALRSWDFPSRERDFREYQFEIVKRALCYNTLVAIPTGLGKTFIAASVILNYMAWFPSGKVFFLAPTKPLCAQQLDNVIEVTKTDPEEAILLTGETPSHYRVREYKKRRLFFMTPQCLENDLDAGLLDAKEIILVVFDEGHRASGNYSYCKIVKALDTLEFGYRILALSATPAAEIEDIQTVLQNLNIAKLEVRDERDPDVAAYLHHKEVDIIKVSALASLKLLEDKLVEVIVKLAKTLCSCRVWNWNFINNPKTINKMTLLEVLNRLKADRERLEAEIGPENISECFNAARQMLSLLNGKVQLSQHGFESFSNFLNKFQNASDLDSRQMGARKRLCSSAEFQKLLAEVKQVGDVGAEHPKHSKLVEVLNKHFRGTTNSKVIIFVQFRNSANTILNFIQDHADAHVAASVFVGQGTAGPELKGMTQKQQLEVIEKFKGGELNVLIATSVGEEGLDIGEVDLIVFFDSISSPIRAIQRMGRTGRKRNGRIVVLSTEGEDESRYNLSMQRGDKLMKFMKNKAVKLDFYPYNPRMFPAGLETIPLVGLVTTPRPNLKNGPIEAISSVKRAPSQLSKSKPLAIGPGQLLLPFTSTPKAGNIAEVKSSSESEKNACEVEIILTSEEILSLTSMTKPKLFDENFEEVHSSLDKRRRSEAFGEEEIQTKKPKFAFNFDLSGVVI